MVRVCVDMSASQGHFIHMGAGCVVAPHFVVLFPPFVCLSSTQVTNAHIVLNNQPIAIVRCGSMIAEPVHLVARWFLLLV